MQSKDTFSVNDWIVHSFHGVGQIEALETKSISGVENDYFKVQTPDSTYWLAIEQLDDDQVRSLATEDEIEAIASILKQSPESLSSNAAIRKAHIKKARSRNTVESVACLIRDLHPHFQNKDNMNVTEQRIYKTIRQRLIKEWVLVTGKKAEGIESRIDKLLSA